MERSHAKPWPWGVWLPVPHWVLVVGRGSWSKPRDEGRVTSWEPMQERRDDTSEDMEQSWNEIRVMRLGQAFQVKERSMQML